MNKNFRLMLCAGVVSLVLALPAAASAVVPSFSLSTPENNQKISGSLSINGYSSNVDIVANCTIPNVSPYSTYIANCHYTNRHVSIGVSISPSLPEGSHSMSVQAIAQDGSNQFTTVSRTVIVDRTAPTIYINGGPANGSTHSGDDFSWSFSASESVTYECQFDGGGWGSCSSPYAVTDIADGSHTFEVRGYDGLHTGSASRTFTVNNAPPTAEITAINGFNWSGTPIPVRKDFAVSISKTREDALVECRVDGGAWIECGTSWYIEGLSEGSHTLEARAYLPGPTDVQDPPDSATALVDDTPPSIDFSAVQLHQLGSAAQVPWTPTEELDYNECSIDNGSWIDPCPTEFFDLDPGKHTVEFEIWDLVGNYNEISYSFYTYGGPPNTFITADQAPATAVEKAIFYVSGPGFSTYECRVDGGAWKACTSPVTVSAGEYAGGSHIFEARATDPVGQSDPTPASTAFTLTEPPAPQKVDPPTIGKLAGKGKKISAVASGAGKISVRVDTCKKKKRKTVCMKYTTGSATATAAGKVSIKLKKKLKKGVKYKLTITSTSSTGHASKTVKTIKAK